MPKLNINDWQEGFFKMTDLKTKVQQFDELYNIEKQLYSNREPNVCIMGIEDYLEFRQETCSEGANMLSYKGVAIFITKSTERGMFFGTWPTYSKKDL